MKKISIIIPIYNTRNELSKCLSSIINQTYKNLEIICIDDGSNDGSEDIVDAYAKMDNRIIVIHQKNAGESNARNTGLGMVTGDYIAFCDCDDWLDTNMYETLITATQQNDLDIIASSWYKETETETLCVENILPVTQKIFGRDELLRYLYMRDSYRGFAYMWNKLYKKELLFDDRGELLRFNENLALGGDVIYLGEIALRVKSATYINQPFYHYYQRESSGSHTKNLKKLRDWIKAYEIIIQRFTDEKIDQEILNYVKRFLAYHSSNAAEIAISQNNQEYLKIFQTFMQQYKKQYIHLNQKYPERLERYQTILES